MPPTLTPVLPIPNLLGLPEKFKSWRPKQAEAVVRALDSNKRFIVLAMPTGFGKSITYMAAAAIAGRSAILTSTKGLQDQLMRDFEEAGLRDVRGMSNYPCREMNDAKVLFKIQDRDRNVACDEGPCLAGWKCGYADDGCEYFDAQRAAKGSDLAITNYAYWLRASSIGDAGFVPALGLRSLLILDEAHNAVDELGGYLAIELGHWEVEVVAGTEFPYGATLAEWRGWAGIVVKSVVVEMEELKLQIRKGVINRVGLSRYKALGNLLRKVTRICDMKSEWVMEDGRDRRGHRTIRFDPVWPGVYAENALFLGIEKIILTSATIRPKTMELLGVKNEDVEFVEYPSNFPVASRPITWIPTVRVKHNMDPGSQRLWAAKIDAIIRGRQDRRGIIHTISYARRDYLLRYSEWADRFVVHEGGGVQDAVERLANGPDNGILVSPSVSTGFDFPDNLCRFQIIGKIPFPDTRSAVLQARSAHDPEFFAYVAAQSIVQMAGRGVRHATDWCETFIIDDNWVWFARKYRHFMPKWFYAAVGCSNVVPEPIK